MISLTSMSKMRLQRQARVGFDVSGAPLVPVAGAHDALIVRKPPGYEEPRTSEEEISFTEAYSDCAKVHTVVPCCPGDVVHWYHVLLKAMP